MHEFRGKNSELNKGSLPCRKICTEYARKEDDKSGQSLMEKLEDHEPASDYEGLESNELQPEFQAAKVQLTDEMLSIAWDRLHNDCHIVVEQSFPYGMHYNTSSVFQLFDNAPFNVSELLHGKGRLRDRVGYGDRSISFHKT